MDKPGSTNRLDTASPTYDLKGAFIVSFRQVDPIFKSFSVCVDGGGSWVNRVGRVNV